MWLSASGPGHRGPTGLGFLGCHEGWQAGFPQSDGAGWLRGWFQIEKRLASGQAAEVVQSCVLACDTATVCAVGHSAGPGHSEKSLLRGVIGRRI